MGGATHEYHDEVSQNIPTPGTQPSFCGTRNGEDTVAGKVERAS